MRIHRTALLVAIAMAVAFQALTQAQQPTAADKAFYTEFLKVCAPQIDAMKKFLASKGESFTDADLRGYFEPLPSAWRDMAAADQLPLVAVLREARAQMIKAANDPNNTDPSDKVIQPSATCFLDALIAKQSAPAASPAPVAPAPVAAAPVAPASAPPSRPAPAPAPAPSAVPEAAAEVGCVVLDFGQGQRGEPALLRNRCTYAVYLGLCWQEARPGSSTEAYACEQNRFEVWKIEARSAALIEETDGDRYHYRACRPPFLPRLWWDPTMTGDARSVGACEMRSSLARSLPPTI